MENTFIQKKGTSCNTQVTSIGRCLGQNFVTHPGLLHVRVLIGNDIHLPVAQQQLRGTLFLQVPHAPVDLVSPARKVVLEVVPPVKKADTALPGGNDHHVVARLAGGDLIHVYRECLAPRACRRWTSFDTGYRSDRRRFGDLYRIGGRTNRDIG